nr:solute carrier family 23 member 1-like [Lytechinus pictus]
MQNGKEVDPAVDGIHVSTVSSPTSSATNGRMPSARYEVEDDAEDAARKEADEILAKLKGDISYGIEDTPAWYTSVLLGFQHYLTMIGSTIAIPLILAPYLCISDDNVALAEVIATMFFVSGVATLLQTFIGNRLPIVQGGTFSFLAPSFAILALKGECLAPLPENSTDVPPEVLANRTEFWRGRMRELQGDIMVASCFQVIIGITGGIGFLLRFLGPLVIAPTIALIGLSLFPAAAGFAGSHWGIACFTIGLMVLFSQYLSRAYIPFCSFSRSQQKLRLVKMYIFRLFPVIMAILLSWAFTYILTVYNVFPDSPTVYGYPARTDIRTSVLQDAPWFRFPYPGQWGLPTLSVAGVFGMLAGVLASMIESVGDYYACARLAGAPPPPTHAVNRGIFIEGFSCVLAGAIGSGNGTTSYSENIGAIGITKVGSRRVIQTGGAIMILIGCLPKFSAIFVTIPDPIVGGMFFVMFGMVAAVGLSNLQYVDLNSSRNIFVLGFAIFSGLCVPSWIETGNNRDYIATGIPEIDQILIVLLSTSMFVGGFFGFILDNTIPGTAEERGIVKWQRITGDGESGALNERVTELVNKCYELPWLLTRIVNRVPCFFYLPFCPNFVGCCKRRKRSDPEQPETINSISTTTPL